jgi:hypothetical protein
MRLAVIPGDGIGTEVVPELARTRRHRLVSATKSNGIVHGSAPDIPSRTRSRREWTGPTHHNFVLDGGWRTP